MKHATLSYLSRQDPNGGAVVPPKDGLAGRARLPSAKLVRPNLPRMNQYWQPSSHSPVFPCSQFFRLISFRSPQSCFPCFRYASPCYVFVCLARNQRSDSGNKPHSLQRRLIFDVNDIVFDCYQEGWTSSRSCGGGKSSRMLRNTARVYEWTKQCLKNDWIGSCYVKNR